MAELSPKILIVDDEMDTRLIIASVMDLMGYENHSEARDGEEALAMLRAETYGLVISDWVMPRMSGIELLKAIRADRDLKRIPFIMVTAEGEARHVTQATDAGATDFLLKPFVTKDLEERVSKALNR
jgi:two-component system, chemotaxis family, chemotaxis protein CheY